MSVTPFQSKFEANFMAPCVIFITRFVNVFICGHFHLVNVFVIWTFSFHEHFRFVSNFVLWVRNSSGNISTKMKVKYPHRFFMHQTLPKLGTKIPKIGETVTSDSFRISDHASVNPTRFGFRTKFYRVTFCYVRRLFDVNLLISV